jgi:hypothetical protein
MNFEENMEEDPPEWIFPRMQWKYFGPILYKSRNYSEFKMRCQLMGYVGYTSGWDEENGIPCYDHFILSEACHIRRTGVMNRKAQKFREQMVSLREKKKKIPIT